MVLPHTMTLQTLRHLASDVAYNGHTYTAHKESILSSALEYLETNGYTTEILRGTEP